MSEYTYQQEIEVSLSSLNTGLDDDGRSQAISLHLLHALIGNG